MTFILYGTIKNVEVILYNCAFTDDKMELPKLVYHIIMHAGVTYVLLPKHKCEVIHFSFYHHAPTAEIS